MMGFRFTVPAAALHILLVAFFLVAVAHGMTVATEGSALTTTPTGRTTEGPNVTSTPTGRTTEGPNVTTTPTGRTTRAPTGVTTQSPAAATTHKPATRGPTGGATTGQGRPTPAPQAPVTVPPAPSPAVGNYTLKDANGKVCMRMKFSCQLNITYIKTNQKEGTVVVNVDPGYADLVSDCEPSVRTLTIYPFTKLATGWTISLEFTKRSSGYSMTTVEATWEYDSRFVDSPVHGWGSESRSQDNFLDQQVSLGSCYTCPEPFTLATGQVTLRFADMKLQPFAEEAAGKFGKAEVCGTGLGQTIIIVIAVAGGVLVLAAVVVVVVVVRKQRNKYRTFQND